MCGHFTQIIRLKEFIEELASHMDIEGEPKEEPIVRYNVPPQTQIKLLCIELNKLLVDNVNWRWKPHWAKDMFP